ncbi:UDP-N-acetylmuramoyl-tripeptide--D-alanyl-D-alanine ligase [Stenotrophobium rhamnosiphilum]|uniref:UDP-N-acetylmuramoyl-tripeptide--D-alanyl-D-alanine ligase n=1 Tax=Stenotrophobium rhamnosiphilum TaxID=2029166 RepID=A0A2T5MDP4_9GAMM|nr:UDP-N-acetylmuramoyl-tripeptide--D-alanyl-D-alanine ligase [Stenotrophobium rhamnosiphilum]PTU30696.1 UDP-N-acetylmuramoyl-tripeptide--D-alanyl-D-alanine ligase [Stenotrophobium rhamnosiphilum]
MMETLYAVAQRIGARLEGANVGFSRVVTDTRTLAQGDLFVALKGENFDGHEFVARAAAAGAVGAIVSRHIDCPLPQIVVNDTLIALQEYAASWRNDFNLPIVAVTGSNGKTTTKQMLSSIFVTRGPVLATQGNFNNHIGLPLTLLSLRREHVTAVIEMGASNPGEIELLTRLTRPNIGVITQAGDAHLEGFGSREGVARAKGELFVGLGGGVAVINADDAYAPLWHELTKSASTITFGFSEQADVRALHVQPFPVEAPVGTRFELRAPEGRQTVNLPLPGRHNIFNALAASACAVALGMDLKDIAAGLARMDAPQGRLSWKNTREGARLLDDSYNANPTSLQAGMELLASLSGERVLVLGGMAELGANATQLHHDAGVAAKALRIDRLYTLGALAAEAAKGFGEGAHAFEDFNELATALRPHLNKKVTLLVKGSRSSRMERVVATLTGESVKGDH